MLMSRWLKLILYKAENSKTSVNYNVVNGFCAVYREKKLTIAAWPRKIEQEMGSIV